MATFPVALIGGFVGIEFGGIATLLMQVGYKLADTYWVGRLGQAAVSALSFS